MTTAAPELMRFLQHENSRLQEENKTLREENQALRFYMKALEDLYWATQRISSEENLLNLLDQILYNAMAVLHAEDGSLLILDEETNELVFVLVHGIIRPELRGYRLKKDAGVAGWVASHGEPLIVNNPRQDQRFSNEVDETFGFVTQSILCVPMMTRDRLIGVIELLNKQEGGDFNQKDIRLLMILAHVAAMALDEMQRQLEAEENSLAAS